MFFGNVVTAMVTPFDENGSLDIQKTESLVEHLIANGSDAIVVAGTTGESPTLTTDEKLSLFKTVVKVANGRVPIIAGTGSNNTAASIELTKKAEEIGVNGIMLVAPYYNKPSQEGLYQHFRAIAASTSLPVMIYNIPGRSSVNISVETTIRLSKVDNIVATKEASGDLEAMSRIIAETDDDFSLYSGDDGLTLPALAIGGVGVVSVAAHIIGNEMQEMVQSFKAGELKRAATLHGELLPVMKSLFRQPNPTAVKAALEMQGVAVGSVRLPLIPLTEEEKQQLTASIQAYL